MKIKKLRPTKFLSIMLTSAMVISSITAPVTGSAAKKVSLRSHADVKVGKKVVLRLKNNKKRVKWSVTAGKKISDCPPKRKQVLPSRDEKRDLPKCRQRSVRRNTSAK